MEGQSTPTENKELTAPTEQPLLAEGNAPCSSKTEVNPSIITHNCDAIPEKSASHELGIEEIETVTIDTDEESPSTSSNLSIPIFSYASVSPICSPPEFSHISGGFAFETNRQDPEGCSSQDQEASSSRKNASTSRIVRASPSTKRQPSFSDALPETEKRKNSSISLEKSPEIYRRAQPSFLESGGFIQPPAFGNFPLPQKGQSLTSFLSSLSDSMPELDRENAHFNVSEALISAFERLKVDRSGKRIPRRQSPLIPDEMEYPEDMFGSVERTQLGPKLCLAEPDSTRKFYSGRRFPRPPIQYTETEESE